MMRKINSFAVSGLILCALLTQQKTHGQELNSEVVNIIDILDVISDNDPSDNAVNDDDTRGSEVEGGKENIEESDNNSGKKSGEKNLRFNILGGPGYTPDYGFLVGGTALFTFDMPGMKGLEKRSVLPFAFSLTFGETVYFSAIFRPQLYFNRDKIRITGDFKYTNLDNNYYGVGFAHNKETQRSEDVTQYFYNAVVISPTISFRIGESDWFLGANYNLQRERISDPAQGMTSDEDYIASGGDESGFAALNNGVGLSVNYDSRDIPSNAYRGIFFDFKGLTYYKFFGGESAFTTIRLKYNQYVQLSQSKEGRTLAWSLTSENVFGDAPFTMLATVGSPFDLRGYYQGQYRDKSAHIAMVEYRHKFNMEPTNFFTKIGNKLGFVAWAGAGVLGPSPFNVEGVLPNYGAGLRYEVQPRMNFRVDVGRSPIEKQTLFYINMTEAF